MLVKIVTSEYVGNAGHLIHDVPRQHQCAGGEGPGVELVQRQDPRKLLQEVFL